MKILLATDGSPHSKAVVEEVASRAFPPNTEIRIISAYDKSVLTMHMESMGTLREYYAEIDQKG